MSTDHVEKKRRLSAAAVAVGGSAGVNGGDGGSGEEGKQEEVPQESPVLGRKRKLSASFYVHSGVEARRFVTDAGFVKMLVRRKAEFFTNDKQVVLVVRKDERVADVWKGLVDHHIMSAPVLRQSGREYYGIIDLHSIVQHITGVLGASRTSSRAEEFWKQVEAVHALGDTTVAELMDISGGAVENVFRPVHMGFSLMHVFELLARERGLHRVPITAAVMGEGLVNMITQSQVVAFLDKRLKRIGSVVDKPISECPLFLHTVFSVQREDIAIDAFNTLAEKQISSLAVVDGAGVLIGQIALRDLKLVSHDVSKFWRFYRSLGEFLAVIEAEHKKRYNQSRKCVVATVDDTIGTVISRLAQHKIHSVFVVDEHVKPIGVVSLKDILGELLNSV